MEWDKGPAFCHLLFTDILLCARAGQKQMITISKTLENFHAETGVVVNPQKSKLLVSSGANREVAGDILMVSRFKMVKNMGKHLGAHLIHGKFTNNTAKAMVERVDGRLIQWKTEFLLMAG
ncbi:hypothetical protein Nepgr_022762 [Nepenthes gracilis]|uniref:Reverse transcriptase domain-containing protein n=1 Tax=Nepenthes gracilis TaxID=150966 RepID=A0AAD3T1A7_NEPGR|nr:hypothetical protein Nepgr_022762 [Nepenthes gracilis]